MTSSESGVGKPAVSSSDEVIGRAFRRSLVVIFGLVVLGGGIVCWLNRPEQSNATTTTPLEAPEIRQSQAARIPQVPFADITSEAGIDFVHVNGAFGDKLLPETMGGGCAFLDYNNDGHQDLLLINSCYWPNHRPAGEPVPVMALFENDGTGYFSDVTRSAGLDVSFYGMGVAIGDYDNDGWSDVFISAVGENHLYHNEQGRFVEVTSAAGVAGASSSCEPQALASGIEVSSTAGVAGARDAWSTGCGWLDYNNDGLLDLLVANYVQWSPEIDLSLERTLDGVQRAYLPPTSFAGTFPYLYRNDGDGRFTDVSAAAGLQVKNPATGVPMAKSLGVVFVDLDNDGWMDIVIGNDTVQNFVFHNQQDGTFDEVGAWVGIAFDTSGQARGAMGIDAARFRNDASLGLAIGNFANEMTALYVSQDASMNFSDEAIATGLGPATRLELTFGVIFFDYDLDGRLDLLAANGHLEDDISKIQESQQYEQPPLLFWNAGLDELTEFPAVPPEKVGSDFHRRMVGRGATYADIDSDGDLDILLTCNGGPPRLLRNDQQLGHHWLCFLLTGTACNRDAVGAWIDVTVGPRVLSRRVSTTRSYLSQSERPVTFGLGDAQHIDRVIIRWPDGTNQPVDCPEVDRSYEVTQAVSSRP